MPVTVERYAPVEGTMGAAVIGDLVVPVSILDQDWFQAGLGDSVDPDSSFARKAAMIAA